MAKHDAISKRMKHNYEEPARTILTRRTPVIIRLDGKAFHTFTKGFKRPYDEIFHTAMNNTTLYLCKNIQGCKLGYTQSDEITLLLSDFDTLTTDAWFDYEVQKMCSIAASMATFAFNRYFADAVNEYFTGKVMDEYQKTMCLARDKGAMFDARCFNIPLEEVNNCFVWRQQDATRNAIQMLGQTHFTSDELHGKNNNEIQDMLFTQKGINFNDMPTEFKRGICVRKVLRPGNLRAQWEIDRSIPIFSLAPSYVEREVYPIGTRR